MFVEMQVEDIDRVLEIEHALFDSPWNKQDFLFELQENPFARYRVLKKEDHIVGYIGYWLRDEYVEITNVAVAKEYQRLGYGRELVSQCIEEALAMNATTFTLEVRVSNMPAIKLYESVGFKIVSVRKNYYKETHEDAYLMLKEVK